MRSLVLTGPPGVGKSAVGRALADALALPFVDTDTLVAQTTGRTPADWLRGGTEAAFRAVERRLFADLLAAPGRRVIACGGGTLLDRSLRHRALDEAFVIGLRAGVSTLASRLRDGGDRPLLAEPGALEALLDARRTAYAECHAHFETDERTAVDLVEPIERAAVRDLIVMPLGERSYRIELVDDEAMATADTLAELGPSAIVFVTDGRIGRAQRDAIAALRRPLSVDHIDVVLPTGEAHKTLESVATIWDAALGRGVDRDVVVVGFGGGVILDLAGFAAATLLRGVRWVALPTTTLAMLDASVGGKTGFDAHAGKNLVGAIHQPASVVVDLAALATLPERDRRAGLAEAVKIALTCDATLFAALEETAEALARGDRLALRPVLRRAIAAKARVVRDDERELGARALLNLGHTVGHGLEAHGAYTRWRHGEAVAVGLVAELRAAARLGYGDGALADRVARLLSRLGLASELLATDLTGAVPYMARDKKRRGAQIALPVVPTVGTATLAHVRSDALIEALAHTAR